MFAPHAMPRSRPKRLTAAVKFDIEIALVAFGRLSRLTLPELFATIAEPE
jgi:hypothetical protein